MFRWFGDDVARAIKKAAGDGLFEGAEMLLEDANRSVPHEEGTLMRSGTAAVDRDALEAAVSFNTPYAVRQHEELDYRHAPGRRAKWLELAHAENKVRISEHIANRIRKAAQ